MGEARRPPVHRLHHSKLGSVYAYTWEWTLGATNVSRALFPLLDSDSCPPPPGLQSFDQGNRTGGTDNRIVGDLGRGLCVVRARADHLDASRSARIRALAVLPLETFPAIPEQDYLSDGMTEALISRLSAIHDLRVISRTSVMRFKGTRKPLPAIGKELNVDALIEAR